jgi:hypothetical protein
VFSPRDVVPGGAVLVAFAAVLAVGGGAARASATADAPFPVPPAGASVYARQLGTRALGLAVVPRGGKSLLAQASVVGRQGNGIPGLRLAFTVEGRTKTAAPCGPGCYRASFSPRRAPRAVDVVLPGGARKWHVALPAAWPPRDATRLVARAGRAWRALESLSFSETLGSGTGHTAVSTWRIQAPDRVAYQVVKGWAGIVIGARRWDRAPGAKRWESSPQTRLNQPVPPWASPRDARVLGEVTYRGRRAVRVSFFDKRSPAWFTLVLDRATLRTLDLRMVTNAHFMHDVYGSFDSTTPIVPPS